MSEQSNGLIEEGKEFAAKLEETIPASLEPGVKSEIQELLKKLNEKLQGVHDLNKSSLESIGGRKDGETTFQTEQTQIQ